MDDYFGNPLDPDNAAAIEQIMAEAAIWNKLDIPVRNWTDMDDCDHGFLYDSFIAEYVDGSHRLKWNKSDEWALSTVPDKPCECCGFMPKDKEPAYQFVTVYVDFPDGRFIDVPFGHIGLN